MRRLITLSVVLTCSTILVSQNLVPNPSFEVSRKCPKGLTKQKYGFTIVEKWMAPNQLTPDYFNNCSRNKTVSVPDNYWGFSYPKNGNAYIGIYSNEKGWREYIQIKLEEPLIESVMYYAEFWVTHAEMSESCAKGLGLALTNNQLVGFISNTMTIYPQIQSADCITDTANWVCISGTFQAKGGEQWVTIGCFIPGMDALMKIKPHRKYARPAAYYFIDDVYVGLLEPKVGPDHTLPQDTVTVPTQPRTFVLPGVFFATGKSDLAKAAYDSLDVILIEMQRCIRCHFEVIGHTDDQGSKELNQALALARASEVAAYFMAKGIASDRVVASGRGAEQPVADNSTEEGRALNRRVEIVVREEMPRE